MSTDIKPVIEALGTQFTQFKANYDERVSVLEKGLADIETRKVAADLGGAASGTRTVEAPHGGIKAMRTPQDFRAHYSTKAQSPEPVSVTDFLRGVAGMSATHGVKAALSVGQNTAGGWSVPAQTMPAIWSALTPASSLLQAGAGIVPLENGAKSITIAVVDSNPSASWRSELGNVVESDPTFRGIVSTPQSLAFYFKVSRELLADSQGIEAALQNAIAQAFAKALDLAGLRGTGTAPEPRGLKNTVGVHVVANGANGAALTSYANLFAGTQAILQADAAMPTSAIMSPRSRIKLGSLADTTGQPLRAPGMLETMQLISTSQIPNNLTVGSSTDCSEIYLGDFSKMFFLMRENLSIQLLRESFATTGEIGFLCHARADVVITEPKGFAVVTGVKA